MFMVEKEVTTENGSQSMLTRINPIKFNKLTRCQISTARTSYPKERIHVNL